MSELVRLLQEGGTFAYVAIALGGLGLALGAVSLLLLLTKNQAALTAGVVTLLCATAAAGAGMFGTLDGHRQVDRALAVVSSRVDSEHLRRQGYREARSPSLLGFGASLLPGLLGLAAALGGARLRKPARTVQGVLEVPADEGNSMLVVAGVFGLIAVLASGGAFVMARAPIPQGRYPFADNDHDSWALANALEDVEKNPARCAELSEALLPFWNPRLGTTTTIDQRDDWPRKFAREPDRSLEWKLQADACTRRLADDSHPDELSREKLLESPLLRDEAVRNDLLARERSTETGKATSVQGGLDLQGLGGLGDPGMAAVGLPKEVIRAVIRSNVAKIRFCYEKELQTNPTLEGTLVVKFVISTSGAVSSAEEASPKPFPSAAVRACVLGRFKAMVFPKPKGGEVTVAYPFVFKTAN